MCCRTKISKMNMSCKKAAYMNDEVQKQYALQVYCVYIVHWLMMYKLRVSKCVAGQRCKEFEDEWRKRAGW